MSRAPRLLGLGVLLLVCGCASGKPAACDPSVAVKLTAEYLASARVECQGYTAANCPALPGLRTNLANALESACPR